MFEIYNPATAVVRPKVPPKLALVSKEYTGPTLVLVDGETGAPIPQGNLLSIEKDGTVRLHAMVCKDYGLQLDALGITTVKF